VTNSIDLERQVCIGVDVGGTFTDAVLTDGAGIWRAKSPTTPGDLGAGVLAAIDIAARRAGNSPEAVLPAVQRFGLGTTAVTNALASRVGRRVGLITTKGFEELVSFARGRRVHDDEGWLTHPPEIVSSSCIVGVDERMDRDGNVIRPLDPADVVAAARTLVEHEGVETLAVSFLWSFRNPLHEQQAVEALAEALPDVPAVSGAALHPAIREFERTTFALLNAYTQGAFTGIDKLAADLVAKGLRAPLLLVHSAGGSISVDEARRLPIGLAESGPAAGVSAAAEVTRALGIEDLVTCDMGGTSFDVSVVEHGEPARRSRGELMGVWTALSLVDVESIGAGGGSIAWIDARGMLRVGPRSAGAEPGPACYGRGGREATVTDALIVLGYVDPARFLGGDMALDEGAAHDACARVGRALGLDARDAAWGIRQLALAGMVKAVRSRLAARGLDPRTHSLFSYGGCGALFTPDIAAALGSPRVLIPELASVLSAYGAATADVRRERLKAVLGQFPVDPVLIAKDAAELGSSVLEDLAADGIPGPDRYVAFEADLRFKRQVWEIPIPLPGGDLGDDDMTELIDAFRAEYGRRYGRGSIVLDAPIEFVSLRAIGTGSTLKASIDAMDLSAVSRGTPSEPVGRRFVAVDRGAEGAVEVSVHRAEDLHPGHTVRGPAVIDGSDTTIWVPETATLEVSPHGTLVLEVRT
jgi:N-methylhydantoinase A